MKNQGLLIEKLYAGSVDKQILDGITLHIKKGEVHVLMGPNGSGKSTLAHAIIGNPDCHISSGKIFLDGGDITGLAPDMRAKKGLFLGFQYPEEIPGVSVANLLRHALNARREQKIPIPEFQKLLKEKLELLNIEMQFAHRHLNEGFSGGEKKRCEILQMALLEPKYCILDEIDSGTDVDAVKVIANGINSLIGTDRGFIIITHYNRILQYLKQIDFVHILIGGKIVKSGHKALAEEIDKNGYDIYGKQTL